jgi:hypothetical protein
MSPFEEAHGNATKRFSLGSGEAIWCSRAKSAETSNAATIGFYYDVPVNAF